MSRKKRKEREFKTQIRESHNLKIIKGGQVETISRATQVNIVPRNVKHSLAHYLPYESSGRVGLIKL